MTLDPLLEQIEKGIERQVGEGEYGPIWEFDADKKNLIAALRKAIKQRNLHHDCGYPEVCQCISTANAELAAILIGDGK